MYLPIFSIQYFGSIHYYHTILKHPEILMEQHEYYIKQTCRNRSYILTANGTMPLIIPVIHHSNKEPVHQKEICYKEKWYKKHLNAIISAYKKAPFFEYYADDLLIFLLHPEEKFLFNFNLKLITKVLSLLDNNTRIEFSKDYIPHYTNDYRNYFDKTTPLPQELEISYLQVFSDRFPFQRNLCVLDLIFNLGPQSKDYLTLQKL